MPQGVKCCSKHSKISEMDEGEASMGISVKSSSVADKAVSKSGPLELGIISEKGEFLIISQP